MKLNTTSFDGALLERGFWLYVWRIKHVTSIAYYVGRTGDSSSQFASSPFSRLGQHLDIRPKATANTLLRNIRKEGFDPLLCNFSLLAVGPLFPEQTDIEKHRQRRDIVAPLEAALASHLQKCGYNVIGTHPKVRPHDVALFNQVLALLEDKL